ncbi:hypothetical protein L579_1348 [Pantoea sp. AS-PWVM4]|nr:hypothetical protein L579_1348 [Pantoea sp. AS-PWVM4]
MISPPRLICATNSSSPGKESVAPARPTQMILSAAITPKTNMNKLTVLPET